MQIDAITYIATNLPAVEDDLFSLEIIGTKGSVPVKSIVIAGHSVELSGNTFGFGADADALVVVASGLNLDGHVLDVGGVQYRIPRTGSGTKTYEFDVRTMDVTELTKPLVPESPMSLRFWEGPGISLALTVALIVLLIFLSRRGRRN